jgi:hypothetical protein
MPIFAQQGMKHIACRDSQRVDHFSVSPILPSRITNFLEIKHTLREPFCDKRLHQCDVGFYVCTRKDQSLVSLWRWAADFDAITVPANKRLEPPLG